VLRFRQAVIAARDLDAAVADLRAALPLGEPYADPNVDFFGLRNAVMPLGDTFVEVVSPARENTAAGRFLDRRGDGAYMAMFQLDDLAGARARAAALASGRSGASTSTTSRPVTSTRPTSAPRSSRSTARCRPSPGAGPARGSRMATRAPRA
jgi:hypothetical protein